jgi:2-desacetyl-2-hydroxyethyl bacteriochlorophyllide A dehydrogenase
MTISTKAVVFTAPRKVEVRAIEIPDIGPKDIGVRTLYSGISTGTEGWVLKGDYWNSEYPTIPGYQKVGVVDKVGSEVTNYKVGDVIFLRVTRLLPGTISHWGGHTGYSVMDASDSYMFKLPAGLDPAHASMVCLPAVGYHGAAEVMPVGKGETVAVIGLGMIGQFSAQTANLRGAKVIALDLIDERLEIAKNYAKAITINPSKQNPADEIKKIAPDGVDAVIDTSANVKVINESFHWLKQKGRYCFQGYYPNQTPIDFLWPHIKELVMYNPTDSTSDGAKECARCLAEGKMQIQSLISHNVPVSHAPEMYEMLISRPMEAMGVVLDWQKI